MSLPSISGCDRALRNLSLVEMLPELFKKTKREIHHIHNHPREKQRKFAKDEKML